MTAANRYAYALFNLYAATGAETPEDVAKVLAAAREVVAAEQELTGADSAYDEQLARDRDAAVADLRSVAGAALRVDGTLKATIADLRADLNRMTAELADRAAKLAAAEQARKEAADLADHWQAVAERHKVGPESEQPKADLTRPRYQAVRAEEVPAGFDPKRVAWFAHDPGDTSVRDVADRLNSGEYVRSAVTWGRDGATHAILDHGDPAKRPEPAQVATGGPASDIGKWTIKTAPDGDLLATLPGDSPTEPEAQAWLADGTHLSVVPSSRRRTDVPLSVVRRLVGEDLGLAREAAVDGKATPVLASTGAVDAAALAESFCDAEADAAGSMYPWAEMPNEMRLRATEAMRRALASVGARSVAVLTEERLAAALDAVSLKNMPGVDRPRGPTEIAAAILRHLGPVAMPAPAALDPEQVARDYHDDAVSPVTGWNYTHKESQVRATAAMRRALGGAK